MTDPSNITGDDDPGEGPNSEADAAPPDDPNIADTTQAEAINNGFIARQQQLLYTDPDAFYRKTGEDALIGTPGILDQLHDLHRETLDLAPTPGVRQRLQSALDSHLALSRDDVLRHTRREAKAWQATTAQNRIDLLTKQAALQYNDPASVAAYAFAAANAGRAHAHATNGDPDESAAAAASSVWRNAIESAVARDDAPSAGTLHADAGDALGPTDANAVAGQLAAAQERMTGRRFADSQPMPETDPDGPIDLGRALAAVDDAHQAATAQNNADWSHDPNQQATNQHFLAVRFGTAKRDVVQAKTELNKAVNDWLAQPGQTERPPPALWTKLLPEEQRGIDTVLAQNANPPSATEGQASDGPLAQSILPFFARPPMGPEVPRIFRVPIPGQGGAEGAKDIPSFARGIRPYVGEKPGETAERVMDGQWGRGRWKNDPERESEFSKLQKHYSRHFQDPPPRSLPPEYDDPGDIPGGERIA
jgi:hypothetical protein